VLVVGVGGVARGAELDVAERAVIVAGGDEGLGEVGDLESVVGASAAVTSASWRTRAQSPSRIAT